ncbi:hypothetical protein AB0L70_10055 [Kribbella sp. NPDC051952]|uniref:hypothetical protein n=1 Tax=Kribbella sp. NPDC051952 TaxID=3154851 RepID=UPI00343495C7
MRGHLRHLPNYGRDVLGERVSFGEQSGVTQAPGNVIPDPLIAFGDLLWRHPAGEISGPAEPRGQLCGSAVPM